MKTDLPKNPSLSPRRQRTHDLMIESILETARAIMREEGVAALSMQELARRMDMRAPSLYHYFSSKMDLYDALFRSGILLSAEHAEKIIQDAQTWQVYVFRTFQAYLS